MGTLRPHTTPCGQAVGCTSAIPSYSTHSCELVGHANVESLYNPSACMAEAHEGNMCLTCSPHVLSIHDGALT